MRIRGLFILFLLLAMSISILPAQSLEDRSAVGFRIGFWNRGGGTDTRIGIDEIHSTVDNTGVSGMISFTHWRTDNLALTIEAGALATEVSSRIRLSGLETVSTYTATVLPVHVGARYYFTMTSSKTGLRPYLGLGVGPVIGTETATGVGLEVVEQTRTEVAFSSRPYCGVDVFLSRHFMLETDIGYLLMVDFSEAIGTRKNYSAPEFTIGISYVFGSAE